MFPYEKQNLVNYRFLLGWTALLFVLCVVTGVLMQKYVGWVFVLMQAGAAFEPAKSLFVWYPEPTAKRQLAKAVGVNAALGVAGYFLVNWTCEALVTLLEL